MKQHVKSTLMSLSGSERRGDAQKVLIAESIHSEYPRYKQYSYHRLIEQVCGLQNNHVFLL